MKLVLAIIHDEDAPDIMKILNQKGFMVTKLASTGGFLRAGNTTLIIGVEDESVDNVTQIFQAKCKMRKKIVGENTPYTNMDGFLRRPVEVEVGGATVFVMEVSQFIKI
ncbi:MAG: cyclic-di-AMP receptor [Anaerotignaceae bacterium]